MFFNIQLCDFFGFVLFIFIFWLCPTACGILVSWPGTEPVSPALEAWSLNHWTAREFPKTFIILPQEEFVAYIEGNLLLWSLLKKKNKSTREVNWKRLI